jgi:hypothetical protein
LFFFINAIELFIAFEGYEQQNGDNNQWLNADGTEVTFTDWDLTNTPQPDSDNEPCAVTRFHGDTTWHDVWCENTYNQDIGYACRFETTKTADEQVG